MALEMFLQFLPGFNFICLINLAKKFLKAYVCKNVRIDALVRKCKQTVLSLKFYRLVWHPAEIQGKCMLPETCCWDRNISARECVCCVARNARVKSPFRQTKMITKLEVEVWVEYFFLLPKLFLENKLLSKYYYL